VIDPDLPGRLYVGTDVGVFRTKTGGQSWETLVQGLPRVVVTDLALHRATRTLRAATFGRGMWDLQLPF
jgi:ligand-binding sensor domain-containing protein